LVHTAREISDAILNLSTIFKNGMIQSHDKKQQIIRDIAWLNVTIYNHSFLFLVIRRIEIALLEHTQHVDEMLITVQHILLGKLQITIVNPKILHNIFRNISPCLPENNKLVAGTRFESIY
jgi:hypothetical protein